VTNKNGYRIVRNYSLPLALGKFTGKVAAPLGIAVDIGTTTIALELVDRTTGEALSGVTLLNSQRKWGSDVISRIRAANEGQLNLLMSSVRKDLLSGIIQVIKAAGSDGSKIGFITIAANTTMAHLLLGLSCAGLGQAPFTPEKIKFPEISFYTLFDVEPARYLPSADCTVSVLPAVSAFIGGDVVGGVVAIGLEKKYGVTLFLDLGTNAEMVLAANGVYYCASAAAGPAFEGGSISCGTGCISGAVSSVRLEGSRFSYKTIPGGEVVDSLVGICGSGILDFVASALEAGLINPDGALAPVCAKTGIRLDPAGKVVLTQRDVREIQLAKAAVRAGIAILVESAGLDEADVSTVYLAGGFGLYLLEESALTVGLLPESFAGKVSAPGNTALAGAVAHLLDDGMAERCAKAVSRAKTVDLAKYPRFEELFIGSMNF